MHHDIFGNLLRNALGELEYIKNRINVEVSQALNQQDYDRVGTAAKKGEKIQRIEAGLRDSLHEWLTLRDSIDSIQTQGQIDSFSIDDDVVVIRDLSVRTKGEILVRMCSDAAIAKGRYWSKQIEIIVGSTICTKEHSSLRENIKELRARYRSEKILVSTSDHSVLELTKDVRFASLSAAAQFVAGYSINGRKSWTVEETGQTINEYEEAASYRASSASI